MQYRLLDLICCPSCRGDVALEVFETKQRTPLASTEEKRCRDRCAYVEASQGAEPDCLACSMIEVTQGMIRCACGKWYPIIGGVPRFLHDALKDELVDRYPEFFTSHQIKIQQDLSKAQRDKISKLKAQTIAAFGYEWTQFADYNAQNFLELIYPVQPDYFAGKLGLDCGCGAGRHTKQAVSYGAEMVAMDISWAVEAAYEKNLPAAHAIVVQCDVFNFPFKEQRFDFIYALGVLHHTTNPPKAFDCLVPLLKPGGGIIVWIYSNKRKFLLFALKMARMVSLKMPNWMVKWTSFAPACIDYGIFIWPYKRLRSVPGIGKVLEKITPPRIRGYAKYDFLVSYADWFDRLSYPCVNYYSGEQVRGWYERNGLTKLKISPTGPFAWRGFGVKPNPEMHVRYLGDMPTEQPGYPSATL